MIQHGNDWMQWDATKATYVGTVAGVDYGLTGMPLVTVQDFVDASGIAVSLNEAEQLGLEKARWAASGFLPPNVASRSAFIGRFTADEYKAISDAAGTDALVFWWLDRGRNAESIDRNDAKTQAGLAMLVAKGLIASGRPAEILAW